MAIIQKKKVKHIEVFSNSEDVVTKVAVEWTTYDTLDPEEFIYKEDKVFTLETDGIDSSSELFVQFSDLTEDTIMGWLSERFQSPRIIEMEERMKTLVASMVNPPTPLTPVIVEKELPWLQK